MASEACSAPTTERGGERRGAVARRAYTMSSSPREARHQARPCRHAPAPQHRGRARATHAPPAAADSGHSSCTSALHLSSRSGSAASAAASAAAEPLPPPAAAATGRRGAAAPPGRVLPPFLPPPISFLRLAVYPLSLPHFFDLHPFLRPAPSSLGLHLSRSATSGVSIAAPHPPTRRAKWPNKP